MLNCTVSQCRAANAKFKQNVSRAIGWHALDVNKGMGVGLKLRKIFRCNILHILQYAAASTFIPMHNASLSVFMNISKKCEKLRNVGILVPVMTQWQPWLSLASKPCATFHHSTLAVSAVNIKVTQTHQM